MKPLSLLAIAAGLAVHANQVASAPISVAVVSSEDGRRIVVPVADDETDPKNIIDMIRPWRLSPDFVRPLPSDLKEIDFEPVEGDIAWMAPPGIQLPPAATPEGGLEFVREPTVFDDPNVHPHPHRPSHRLTPEGALRYKGCVRKYRGGFKYTLARKMRNMMNRFRAALGLPLIQPLHHPHHASLHPTTSEGDGSRAPHWHHHHHNKQDGDHVRFMEEVDTPIRHHHRIYHQQDQDEAFLTRFAHAMHSLSPWESRAVTFVFGLGLGAVLRMFIVLAIIMVRGRRACRARGERRFGARRHMCRRRLLPEDPEAVEPLMTPAPPAYSDEKIKIVESAPAVVPSFKEVITVEMGNSGTLLVWWQDNEGAEHMTPAPEFHQMYPQQLLKFYESNLKWKPIEEEHGNETHQ